MARKTTAQAAPSGGPQVSPAPPDQAGSAVAATDEVGTTAPAVAAPGAADPQATEPTAPSGDLQIPAPFPDQADAAAAAPAGEEGTTAPAATTPGAADLSEPASEQDTHIWVRALVLHDSIYGKCGEVREFDAEHVPALKGAGYIDPHPKAVESAGG
ncbi:hypothetical protein [Achromobacter denitrificans]|uniref:hypothetical protein n=1 Tax=Achromobacter denitrificans TaxID=32002 RepID=UPI0023E84E58|nr:hypothetical protein [Achromobacter denitrificans]MDF3851358.1 hypothetical protein [Achromobacter denitrificans]